MRTLTFLLLAAAALAAPFESLEAATLALETALAQESPAEAADALAALPALYAAAEEKQQKAALSAVAKAAKSDDLRVRHGAFAALGALKVKGSSKALGRWLNPPKHFKGEIPPSYTEAIRAAGQIADATTLVTLEKLSDHAEITIAEEATKALGGFHTLPTKRRKDLAFDLVDRLNQLSAQQRRKASEEVYERKARLAAATVQALQGLTGEQRQTLEGWQKWREQAEKEKDPFS